MITNIDIYLSIAEEAHSEMEKLDSEAKTPKPDGSSGFIIKYDPERKSFKQAFIVIAFCGMYFEALIYLTASKQLGSEMTKKIDKMLYEDRLKNLGITDSTLLSKAEAFRKVRKDLVHEKAIEPADLGKVKTYFAQKSARQSLAFIYQVRSALQNVA